MNAIVLGAGLCGLAAGMMLARDGHDVTVLERDAAPVPESPEAAWERWGRDGVAQFRQAHLLQAHVGRSRRPAGCASMPSTGCPRRSPIAPRGRATSS